jgi:hypothetical protein
MSVVKDLYVKGNLFVSGNINSTLSVSSLLQVPQLNTSTIKDSSQTTSIVLNTSTINVSATDLTLNGVSLATETYVDTADSALQDKTQNITATAGNTTITGNLTSTDTNLQDIYNASGGFSSMSIYATPLAPTTNNVKLNTGSIDIKFDDINLDGTANTKHLAPVANNLYDLGTSLLKYNTIHANKLTGLNTPVAGEDSANKTYVDTADSALQTSVDANTNAIATKGLANGLCPLNAGGIIDNQYIPPLAISKPTVYDSITDRDADTNVQMGDVAIVSDEGKSYIFGGSVYVELITTGAIASVNGKSGGSITLDTDEINEVGDSRYYTVARDALKADLTALNTVQTNVNTEATTRANDDTTLQTNINTEATTRANADTALTARLDNITDSTGLGEVLKPPSFTTVQRDTITQIDGLVIYNTDRKKLETSDGTVWYSVVSQTAYDAIITPHDLTSNISDTSFIVSASSFQPGGTDWRPWNAFNGDLTDIFVSEQGTYTIATGLPTSADFFEGQPGSYIKASLNEPRAISKYQIAPFDTRAPIQWRILTSMDDATWTVATTQGTDYVYNNGFEVYSDDIFLPVVIAKYIVIQFTKITSGIFQGDKVVLSEINFDGVDFVGPIESSDPVYPQDVTTKNYVDTADTTLQTNINTEATTRSNDDTTLQTNITTEATTRSNADTALTARLDNITDSTSLGEVLKPPSFTTVQRDTITADGLVIYNTDNKRLETSDGTYWSSVASTKYYTSVITPHNLTSNGSNSNFVVSSSSTQASDTEAWKAFNGVFSDGFISAPGTYVLSTGLPTAADSFQDVPGSWLKISLNEPKVISKYQIAPFLVSAATRKVLQWRILTSMDNLTWTLAATQNTDYVYNNGAEVYSDDIVLTPVAAKYIIFQITKVSANQTLGDKALIAEINFDGTYLDGPVQINDYTIGQDATGRLMTSHSDGGMMIIGNTMINAATSFSTCNINYSTMLPSAMLASITAASGGFNKCWGQTATYVADIDLLAGRVVSLADQTNGSDNALGLRVNYLKVGGVVVPGVSPVGITQHNCLAGNPVKLCIHGYTTAISLTAQVAKRGSVAMAGSLDADFGKIRINTAAAVIQASIGFVAQSDTVGIDDPVLIYYSGFMQPT